MIGINVFIEYEIIKNSSLDGLIKELDILIAAGKKIYIWSKNISPIEMKRYCISTFVKVPNTEYETHKKIYSMRKDGKSYQEISNETGVKTAQLGYYIKNEPKEYISLDHWIIDYLPKDSTVYPKVDIVIDNDKSFVERFTKKGLEGNYITKI